jgi:hypothetical protein
MSVCALRLELAVKSSVYTLTPFDMWILASEYEVPVILFSGSGVQQQPQQQMGSTFFCNGCSNAGRDDTNARILYSDGKADTRYHVIVCTHPVNSFPVYGIVQYGTQPDTGRLPPITRYSIEQKDLKYAEPVSSMYAKNETVFDFISKSVAPTKGPVTLATSATAAPPSNLDIMKSLPLVEMKKTEAFAESAANPGADVETHDPEIKRLLTHGKEQLETSIRRLESPGVDPGIQANVAQAKDKLDHMNI